MCPLEYNLDVKAKQLCEIGLSKACSRQSDCGERQINRRLTVTELSRHLHPMVWARYSQPILIQVIKVFLHVYIAMKEL